MVTAGSTVSQVWLAVRDSGALTIEEIAAKVGHHAHQIAPVIHHLIMLGWLTVVDERHTYRRYINTRLARTA